MSICYDIRFPEQYRLMASSGADAFLIAADFTKATGERHWGSTAAHARHLFSSPAGYASFYFAYRWAEVLDKDIFEAFERAGGPDRETARKFRKAILEKGYTVPPMQQFMDFMGRKPRMDAMLRKRRLAS